MTKLLEPQMDLLLPEDLDELIRERTGPCVSIYMPTHRIWNETPQDPILLKNLRREAERQLVDNGHRPTEARALLEPVLKLEHDDTFWRHQCDGLAIFRDADAIRTFRLPLNFDELVVTHDRFHVKPLLRFFEGDGRFYVLALNLDRIRLLGGTQYNLTEVDLVGIPRSLSEALQYDDFEKHQQFRGGTTQSAGMGRGSALYHGQGDAADDASIKKRISEFFRRVDNGVCDALKEEHAPLVLAGLAHLRGMYREANHYRHLAEQSVEVNPANLTRKELHAHVWGLVEPLFRAAHEEAVNRFAYLSSNEPEKVSAELDDVVKNAWFSRVNVLFARADTHSWGRFDPEHIRVEHHDRARSGDLDLLDFAVTQTLRNAGTVYMEDLDTMPADTNLAAIFRY